MRAVRQKEKTENRENNILLNFFYKKLAAVSTKKLS